MATSGQTNTTPAQAGVDASNIKTFSVGTADVAYTGVEEVQRVADDDRSVRESRAGEALAKNLGITVEELDRRLQSEDKQRDAAGLPPLAWSQVKERASLDDFAPDPGPPSKLIHDTPGKEAGQQDEAAPGKAKASKEASATTENEVEDQSRRREREAEELRLAREQRQREALLAVNKQYNGNGTDFYTKETRDEPSRLAFTDRGSKMVAYNSETGTAKAMALMAEGKGWSTIKVAGTEKFKRDVWLEASLRGVQVQGYKPKETDLAELQALREKSTGNKVYPVNEPTKKWTVQERGENGLYKDVLSTDDAKAAHKAFIGDKARRVLDNGIKDYAADHTPRTVPRTGETVLEPDYHKRSTFAKEAGVDRAPRTGKEKVVEAVASAVVADKVKNPAVRDKVMQEVNRQLDKRASEGRTPTVQVYDVAAPSKPREQAPVVQREKHQDRTR